MTAIPTPASFAVHDEGHGLLSLWLTPCPTEVLADAFDDLGVEVVHGGRELRFPPALLAALSPPLQVSSHPCEPDVLVAPHASVPAAPASFVAKLSDEAHGVVHAREERVLVATLRRWLGAHLDAVGAGFGLDGVTDDALRALVAPIPASWWTEPRLVTGRRISTLEFSTVGPADEPVEGGAHTRWIRAERSGWRTDWSW